MGDFPSEDSGDDVSGLPPPFWVGDHLALDFLNTVAKPKNATLEWLSDGAALLGWLAAARVLSEADRTGLEARFSQHALNELAATARALRENFRQLLVARTEGAALTPEALAPLNRALAAGGDYVQLSPGSPGTPPRLTTQRPWRTPEEVLAPVSRAMAELLCEDDLTLVHECEGPRCTLWFYDRTKGHRRRWCSQAVCGNRAKAAAFRARKSEGT